MLQIFTKKQFNLAIIFIATSLIPLQFISSLAPIDIDVWNHAAPFSKFIGNSIGVKLLANSYFNFALSIFLIYIQLFLVYNVFNKFKNIEKNSLLATWLYLWCLHLFPSMANFSPALISSTLILIVIYQFHYHIESKSFDYLFKTSILVGLSFLIWYPSIAILLFMLLVLFQYNELSIKKVIIILTSFIIPLIYFICYYLYNENGMEIIYKLSNFHLSSLSLPEISIYQIITIISLLLMIALGAIQSLAFSSQTIKATRLFMNSLFTFSIIAILSAFLSLNSVVYSLIILCFPISLFLVHYINIFKRPLFAELAHLSLILLLIINFVLCF